MIRLEDTDSKLPLKLSSVTTALEGSWLFDWGQGNFAAARQAAEQALSAQRNAHTLFVRAIVHQLQGEYALALPLFESAFLATSDPDCQLLITAMAHLAERQRGDFLPDGLSINFPETQQQWGRYQFESEWMQRQTSLSSRVQTPAVQGLTGFISQVLVMLPTYGSVLWSTSDPALRSQRLQDIRDILLHQSHASQISGFPKISIAIDQFIAELTALAGEVNQALRQLERLIQICHEQNLPLGVASCWLLWGDITATVPPLGHPRLLGYRLSDQVTDTTVAADPDRFDRTPIDILSAHNAYTQAHQYFAIAQSMRGEAIIRSRLAYLDAVAGKWQQAAQSYDAARQQFAAIGDRVNLWSASMGNNWARLHLDEPEPTLSKKVEGIAFATRQNEAIATGLSWGLTLAYAGREAFTQGRVDRALRAAHLAQSMFVVLDAPLRQVQTLGDRAHTLGSIGAIEASVNESEAALRILKQTVLKQGVLKQGEKNLDFDSLQVRLIGIQHAQQIIRFLAGQYDAKQLESTLSDAEGFVKDLPPLSPEIPQFLSQVDSDNHSLNPLELLGEAFEKLSSEFNLFILYETYHLIKDQTDFDIPFAKGMNAIETNRIDKAEEEFTIALAQAEGHPEANFRRARVFAGWRKYAEARAALREYVQEGTPEKVTNLKKLQSLLDPHRAIAETQRQQVDLYWMVVALAVTIHAWEDAQSYLQAIEQLTGQPLTLNHLSTQDDILNYAYQGSIAEGLLNFSEAIRVLTKSIEVLEFRRRFLSSEFYRRAFGGQRPVIALYVDLARVLAHSGDWHRAFEVAEKAHARVLSELIGGRQIATSTLENDLLLRQYLEQSAVVERLITQLYLVRSQDSSKINHLQNNLNQAIDTLNQYETSLFQRSPKWRELLASQTKILSINEVASRLPLGTLLLAYIFLGEQLLIWAITAEGLVHQHSLTQWGSEVFIARSFGTRVREWALKWNAEDADPTEGKQLAEILLHPFDHQIAAANHLVIVPFAELNLFPFAALPWHDHPLGLHKSISYLPAASLLQYFRSADVRAEGALVIGNPADMMLRDTLTGKLQAYPLLPAAGAEAELIAKEYGSQPLTGKNATKTAVREALSHYPSIIHLATHGFFSSNMPLASGVALANGEMLTVDEIIGLDLRADVVILSACDTGQGKLQGGELLGLARSFLSAGARAIVLSPWEADDLASTMLMQFLHQHLIANRSQPLAQSLWQAQQQLSQVTTQQALDFCRTAQRQIPWHQPEDRADRALFTRYMGDIWAMGGDFDRAVKAYEVAHTILTQVGYSHQVKAGQKRLEQYISLAPFSEVFDRDQLIFTSPQYWANFEIIGDWR